jgi:hypothetical protein
MAALELNPNYPPTRFNLACFYALGGDTMRALDELQKTIELEPAARHWAINEPDLQAIRAHPRFRALVR